MHLLCDALPPLPPPPLHSRDNSRASGSAAVDGIHTYVGKDGMHTYVGKDGKRETLINDVYKKSIGQTPLVTVINADMEQGGGNQPDFLSARVCVLLCKCYILL